MLFVQLIFFVQAFLETKLEEHSQGHGHLNHYIFTDSDMAVVNDLGQIFQKHSDFHLALTFRNNKDQPLNSGFIAVRGTREGILRFLICVLISLPFIFWGISFHFLEPNIFIIYLQTWNSKIGKWLWESAAQTCAIHLCVASPSPLFTLFTSIQNHISPKMGISTWDLPSTSFGTSIAPWHGTW